MRTMIVGRIRGRQQVEWPQFRLAEQLIEGRALPINPFTHPAIAGSLDHDGRRLHNILMQLMVCDSVYCLKGWRKDREARLIHSVAEALGLNLLYQRRRPPLPNDGYQPCASQLEPVPPKGGTGLIR